MRTVATTIMAMATTITITNSTAGPTMYGVRTTFCRHRLQDCLRAVCAHVSAGQVTPGTKTWCGRRDLNPHGPFKPCGFSCRLRLSPPGCEAVRGLTPGLRSGLSLHPTPEDPELRCCPSSLYTFPAGISPVLARDCHLRVPRI